MINEPRLIRIANFQTSYHADINRLLTQLDPECSDISEEHLRSILSSESSELYALELDGKPIGMTTLALLPLSYRMESMDRRRSSGCAISRKRLW